MTITRPEEVLEFGHFKLQRFGPENKWLVTWHTGHIEYLDTNGQTNQEFIARHLADRLEELVQALKENRI